VGFFSSTEKEDKMALQLPDGATLSLATAYGSVLTVSGISNAATAVATSTAHGLANGDFVEVTSGWNKINGRIFRVAGVTANTFNLDGFDSTSVTLYPAGTGGGSVRKINTWQQIQQVLTLSTSGGEQQYATVKLLEENVERKLPTFFSSKDLTLEIADDPSLAGYQAVKAASDLGVTRGLRLSLKSGSFVLYNGIPSLNETPTVTSGEVMRVTMTFALQGLEVRYAS